MENVWDQTSVCVLEGIQDHTVLMVEYNAQNYCQAFVFNFLTTTCVFLHDLPTRISIYCLNNVSYWLQMWTSVVCCRDHVPSAAWIHTVAIAVTVNLDTRLVQMDTPAPVSSTSETASKNTNKENLCSDRYPDKQINLYHNRTLSTGGLNTQCSF